MATATSNTVSAGTWELSTAENDIATESMFLVGHGESTFEVDNRERIDPADFAPGGKYRSIVKLQMRYAGQGEEDSRWAMGTGWLIRDDLLVTAGHCAYDWSSNFGRCVQVKAYIGYNGKDSVLRPDVQFRTGKKIVTTGGWLAGAENRNNDVAFIQVNKPFTGVKPFQFDNTPIQGNELLGVVGYPGDKRFNELKNGERGAQMWGEYVKVKWNLDDNARHMLEYEINTFAGQSGSPVIRQGKNISIGAHVYGGAGKNSASPIGGNYGNPYSVYLSAFDKAPTVTKTSAGVKFVSIPATANVKETGESEDDDSEGFFDVLKKVIKIGAPIAGNILSAGSLFLGPGGAAVAALAGTALNAAGKMAESGFDGEESGEGHFERALLAEAALQTVLNMSEEEATESGIFDNMKKIFKTISPQAKRIAPKILPVVLEPALRLSLDALQKKESGTESEFEPTSRREPLKLPASTESGVEEDAFTTQLLAPTIRETGDESFWSSLGSVLKKAVKHSGLIGKAVGLVGSVIGGESDLGTSELDQDYENLFDRAIMAEAALQALQQAPAEALQAEGLFDSLKSIVQKIGPKVIKLAPKIIKGVLPIAGALLGGESAMGGALIKKPIIKKPINPPPFKTKPTIMDIINARTVKPVSINGVNGINGIKV